MPRKLKKSVRETLVLYCLLVYHGLKDAYLVDCCSLDSHDAANFIQEINRSHYLIDSVLVTLNVSDDTFVVNEPILRKKLSNMAIPCVVDVNQNGVFLCPDVEVLSIMDQLKQSVINLLVPGKELTQDFFKHVSLPLLAGWLLGYPSVYRSVINVDLGHETAVDTAAGGALSMIELHKTAICVDIEIKTGSEAGLVRNGVDLLSFSVPQLILDEAGTGTAIGIKGRIKDMVQSHVNQLECKILHCEAKSGAGMAISVRNICVNHESCLAPSIVL